jgi:hypothetical protein
VWTRSSPAQRQDVVVGGDALGDTLGGVGRLAGGELEPEASLPKSYVRLTHPLVRDTKGGELRQATWDEALDRTVAGLRAALMADRPEGTKVPIGIFSCSKSTNEVNYAAQKLSRVVLGSNNIDSCNRT